MRSKKYLNTAAAFFVYCLQSVGRHDDKRRALQGVSAGSACGDSRTDVKFTGQKRLTSYPVRFFIVLPKKLIAAGAAAQTQAAASA